MDDLVQWLRDQLDEDGRIARAAAEVYGGASSWRADVLADPDYLVQHMLHIGERTILAGLPGDEDDPFRAEELAHIAAHDPARVLREIEAKRRAIDECAYWNERAIREATDPPEHPQPGLDLGLLLDAMNPILRALALPYADRPGYREEWRT